MMLRISENVFIPVHRVERLSFFGTYATLKYIDSREVDRIEGEDAQRLRMCVDALMASRSQAQPEIRTDQKGRRK